MRLTPALIFIFLATSAIAHADPAPVLGSPTSKKGGNFRYELGVAPATLNPITAHWLQLWFSARNLSIN